jgi:uncharacterized protein affecting Mg2+/Co2+ transport
MKYGIKLIALAVALVVVIGAVAVIASQGPVTTGSADQGENSLGTTAPGTTPTTSGTTNNNLNENQQNNGDAPDDGCVPVEPTLTTISAEKTANGFFEKTNTYTWSVDKEIDGNDDVLRAADCDGYDIVLEPGDYAVVSYMLSVDRSGPVVSDVMGVRGEITVTNTGCNDTVGLMIWDTIQVVPCGGAAYDYVTFQVDTSSHPVLAAGESYSYSYEAVFEGINEATYHNVANVTITNYVDHNGEAFGVLAGADFALPICPTVTTVDETASLRDDFTVPCGFTVEALTGVGPWCLGDDDNIRVELKVTNVDATRNVIYTLCNQAILEATDSGTQVSDNAPVTIYSGPFETTLCVVNHADASWSEAIELELGLPDGWSFNDVEANVPEVVAEMSPVEIAQNAATDVGTYNVWGTVMVKNTGANPTEGLAITATIQMWNETCRYDVVTISVDVSCMPVLQPGESYCYAYAVTFTLDDVSALSLGCYNFDTIASVQICNYDDDAALLVVDNQPLEMPIKPCVLTMHTTATYTCEEVKPLGITDCDAQLIFDTDVTYEQMVTVHFFEDRITVDTCTNVMAHTTVTQSYGCESVCQELNTAIHHAESSVVTGDDNQAVLAYESTAYDNDTLVMCIMGNPVELNLCSVLYANDYLAVHSSCEGYMFDNTQMVFYGVFASFVYPEDACQDNTVEA